LQQRWVPDNPACPLRRLTAQQIKRCLARKNIVFWGDSLARNHFHSLQCMLMEEPEEVGVMHDGARNSYHSAYAETQTSARFQHSFHVRPVEMSKIANASVLVVSTGPHWVPSKLGVKNTTHVWTEIDGGVVAGRAIVEAKVKETIDALLQQLPSSTRIVWRTPDISHSPTRLNPWLYDCAPYAETTWNAAANKLVWDDAVQWVHDAVMQHTAGTRIEVMNVLALSGMRADAHPSAHLNLTTRGEGKPTFDCLHWCLPGVPDTWNEILVNYLCQEDF
jgi:hypothetical protein